MRKNSIKILKKVSEKVLQSKIILKQIIIIIMISVLLITLISSQNVKANNISDSITDVTSNTLTDNRLTNNPLSHKDCATMTMHGFLPDFDCDGVPDVADNCPKKPNSQQIDHNLNGLGDACDLMIDNIEMIPTTWVKANEFLNINIIINNNNEEALTNVHVKIKNKNLKIDVKKTILILPAKGSEKINFMIKIPPCTTPKDYTLLIDADYKSRYPITNTYQEHQEENIKIIPGGSCQKKDNTIINMINYQEIDEGENLIIPIKLINLNQKTTSYKLKVENITGTYRIDPKPEFSIASGEEKTVYLYVNNELSKGKNENIGGKKINLMITHGDSEEKIPITIRTRKIITKSQGSIIKNAFEVTAIIILFALIIAGAIIGYRKINETSEDDDNENDNNKDNKTHEKKD